MTLILVAVLLLLFGLLMLGWPRTGTAFAIVVTMLWPAYLVIQFSTGPGFNPQRVMLPICLLAWLIHVVSSRGYRRRVRSIWTEYRILILSMVALFAIGIVSGVLSPFNKSQAIWGAFNQVMFLAVPMLLVVTYFDSRQSISRLVGVMLGITIISQIVGAIEYANQEVVFNRLVSPGSEHAEKILEGKTRLEKHRVTSVFDNPLSYAQFLVFMLPVFMHMMSNARNIVYRLLAGTQLVVLPVCVWTTGSRTAMVLMIFSYLAGALYWVFRKRLDNRLKVTTAFIVTAVSVALFALTATLFDSDSVLRGSQSIESSTNARLFQLAVGIPAISVSPFIGVGIHQATNFMQGLTSIDNYYLTVVLEKGVIGLILLLAVQWLILKGLIRESRISNDLGLKAFSGFLIISYSSLFLFELTLSVIEVFTVSNVILACFWSWTARSRKLNGKVARA